MKINQGADAIDHWHTGGYVWPAKERAGAGKVDADCPEIVLADEATAALDGQNAKQVARSPGKYAEERITVVMLLSHDHKLIEPVDRFYRLMSL